MLSDKVKANINRIDFELKELFSVVKINENSYHNRYFFEIQAEGVFNNLFESNQTKKVKSVVIIEKKDLEQETITWRYSVNPNDYNADFIKRVSNIENIAEDIHNTIQKKQMDINYLNSTPEVESIEKVEEVEEVEEERDSFEMEVEKTMERYQVEVKDLTSSVNPFSGNLYDKPTKTLLVHHNGIDTTKMFKLEAQLLKLEKVNYIFFDKDFVKINHN